MTDNKSDNGNAKPDAKPAPALIAKADAKPAAPVAPAPKSGRGVAWLALLVGLGAGGGSGYLWYLWQQDQATQADRLKAAIKQAIDQRDPAFKALEDQVKALQTLKASIDQVRAENQNIQSQILGLTGDLQPLKNAMELYKGENQVIKSEMNLVREGQTTHQTALQQQKAALDQQLQEHQARLAQLDTHIQDLKLSYSGMADNLETVKTVAARGGDVNAFPLAEVDYLLRLADAKLKLERNIAAARLALDVAQQRLKAVNESGLAPVQTMLAEAIASLRGVQLPDIVGLAHKLADMEKDVSGLPIKIDSGVPDIKSRVKPAATVTVSADAERSWWDRSTEAVWNQFKDIVVIRRVRSEAPPLIAIEEEFFLRQNLRLELESMRMALLRGDAQSYQDSYELVRKWTETYFDVQDARVTAFLSQLQALQTVQFNPYLPDLAGLNKAFTDALTRRQPIRPVLKTPADQQSAATEGAQP
ncbi:MAG: uroporphyrinogen-III C-methyltransferase [Candidatus Contendobacter sp.]|nr:uroporphyrinogen-III C-methyltransferase [Candidatus Contendobacter sp.]